MELIISESSMFRTAVKTIYRRSGIGSSSFSPFRRSHPQSSVWPFDSDHWPETNRSGRWLFVVIFGNAVAVEGRLTFMGQPVSFI